jgi:hypothetical protein
MDRLREILRSGDWLTRERIRLVAATLLFASGAGFLYLVLTSHGAVDLQGRPLGTDFSNVYAAGTYVLDGNAAAAFDPVRQYARERAIFGDTTQFYGWHYPPFFLFAAAALAWLPYGLALAVWQAVTLGLYLLAIRAIVAPSRAGLPGGADQCRARPEWIPHRSTGRRRAGFARPPATPRRHPVRLAGLQAAIRADDSAGAGGERKLALLCRRGGNRRRLDDRDHARIRCIGVARVLRVFRIHAHRRTRTGQYRLVQNSKRVCLGAHVGAPIPLAYALQGAVALALAGALAWLWRSAAAFPLKAAALCLGTILATPYSLDYDMMVLAPAIAFLAADGFRRGFAPWEKMALAALWLVPLVARSAGEATLIPLGVPAMLTMFALVLWRAGRDAALPDLAKATAFSGASSR